MELINDLPEGWKIVSLGDKQYFEILSSGIKEFKDKKMYISTKCINGNKIIDVESEITYSNRPSRANMQPVMNSVWFAKMKNTIKVYAFTEENEEEIEKYILSTGFCGIKCKDKITTKYLEQFFMSSFFNKIKDSLVTGSTQQDIKNEAIAKIPIILPTIKEREKIVDILSTMDSVIQKVDEIIAKTERLKKGLMKELLTGRIRVEEKDGKIIFRKETEFKEDTEIGKVPKDWEVVKVGDKEIAEIRGNKRIKSFDKVAFIPMELIPDSTIFATYEIRSLKNVKSYIYCEGGDILLAKITPSLENGKQGLVPYYIPNGFALATTEVFPIKCKGINRLFLFYILKFSKFRNKIIASMIGTTGRKRASKKSIENLKIPFPPPSEQEKIAEILLTIDNKLELERKRKEKLEKIKKGLMDLLLTGRIRVKT
jgi:type I restriction enzyme S subunit